VTGLAEIRIVELIRPMLPFMAAMFATILLPVYVPAFRVDPVPGEVK
jgi:TRAP-type C4-dicarboxylate transport system permease large subunit